jgi:uncharacterized protein with HEPN domain
MKDPRVYLAQILECTERIQEYTGDGKNTFTSNQIIQDAVIRNFEVMCEAAKHIPPEYRGLHPDIPWRMIAGFRDVLIHNYENVDPNRVWLIIEKELPILKAAVSAILPPLEQLESEIADEDEQGESK